MPTASTAFTVRETHGMFLRPENEILASGDNKAWPSLYASLQREVPFEDSYEAVQDQLIVLHLGGPVMVHRRIQKGEASRLIPPGGLFMMPGGMDLAYGSAGPYPLSISISGVPLSRKSHKAFCQANPLASSCYHGLATAILSSSALCWVFGTRSTTMHRRRRPMSTTSVVRSQPASSVATPRPRHPKPHGRS